MNTLNAPRPPLPPFTDESAIAKVRLIENIWNTRDPQKVARAYSEDSIWRNRADSAQGRPTIIAFLTGKWQRELEYRIVHELWAASGSRIAVRFAFEWRDTSGSWFRSYGNENWEFNDDGLMHFRHASIGAVPIKESERKFHWDATLPRPLDHPGLTVVDV